MNKIKDSADYTDLICENLRNLLIVMKSLYEETTRAVHQQMNEKPHRSVSFLACGTTWKGYATLSQEKK